MNSERVLFMLRNVARLCLWLTLSFSFCGCAGKLTFKNPEAYPARSSDRSLAGLEVAISVDCESQYYEKLFKEALATQFNERYGYLSVKHKPQIVLDVKLEKMESRAHASGAFAWLPGIILFAPTWYPFALTIETVAVCDIVDYETGEVLLQIRQPLSMEADYLVKERGVFLTPPVLIVAPIGFLVTLSGSSNGMLSGDVASKKLILEVVAEQLAYEVHKYLKTQVMEADSYDY